MTSATPSNTRHRRRNVFLAAILIGLAVVVAAVVVALAPSRRADTLPLSFDGRSDQMMDTQVVPTLDTPIEPGKNVIWCASFQAAWKKLQADVVGAPIRLAGAEAVCDRLNAAADPAADLPPGSHYAAAGRVDGGIVQTIGRDLRQVFPDASPPPFDDIPADSLVAYALMRGQVQFSIPYFDSQEPLRFTGSAGQASDVRAFGIRKEDDYAYTRLRAQVKVLYVDPHLPLTSEIAFALDLCRESQPSQVVVACIPREPTLASTLAALEAKIAAMPKDALPHGRSLGPNDTMLVPVMAWRLVHNFEQLMGHQLANNGVAGWKLSLAMQDILFRLDRGGMELRSESKIVAAPIPYRYHVNRPFLLYAKKRGADQPYLVMWIDNAELLTRQSAGERQ